MDFDWKLLINPLIVAGIGAFLAAMITVIDRVVNNYGQVKVSLNEGKRELEVKGGSPLLTTLAGEGIFVPSACGGRGTCGACKVRVTSDIGPVYPTEKPFLTAEEEAAGTRLSCQIKVKAPIEIAIPDELFNVRRFRAEIAKITDVTHDIKEIRFRLLDNEEISYEAGQYMQFEIPPYGKIRSATQRAYSIASNPVEKNMLELLIRLVPNGIVTTYVFTQLREGQVVDVVGPFGDFTVRETGADMICVAGGSGMAPIKSIIYDLLEKGERDRHLWYFFGARSLQDLFFVDELKAVEERWPNFHFIPALSEPAPEDNWQGESGLITDVLDRYLKERVNPDNPKEGYLCGSPGMIGACIKVMTANGIEESKIYYDKFA